MKLKNLSILAFCMAIVVVVLGAYTRLVDAGLGCPDWPTCYGHLWVPNTDAEIAKANENFSHAPVEAHKTWPEQIHRIFASSLGLVIFTMFALVARTRFKEKKWKVNSALLIMLVSGTVARVIIGDSFDWPLLALAVIYFVNLFVQARVEGGSESSSKLVALLAGFVILQGWFGMWTVTLNLWPQVVTTHLLGGFATLTLIWLCVQRSSGYAWDTTDRDKSKALSLLPWGWLLFVLVVLQITLGGWTTSNYAALACPDFPTCHAEWWPHSDFVQGFNIFQHVGPNYLGGQLDNHARTAIHLSHRLGALAVFVSALVLLIKMWMSEQPAVRRFAGILAFILVLQISLGITNVVAGLPLLVAVAHNAVGAALLLCIVTLLQRLYSLKKA